MADGVGQREPGRQPSSDVAEIWSKRPRRRIRRGQLVAALALAVGVGVASAAYSFWLPPRAAPTRSASTSSSTLPSPRSGAAMAYDPQTQTTILFGGDDEGRTLDDTWSWNGSSWTELHPATSPIALAGAMLAYDPESRWLVLAGGTTEAPGGNPDNTSTWTWNGSTWRLEPSGGVEAPAGSVLASDPATEQVILVDTADPHGVETWLWNSGSWVELHPATSPPRSGPLAFDTETNRLVLVALPDALDVTAPSPTVVWSWVGSTWASQPATTAVDLTTGEGSASLATSADGLLMLTSTDTYRWTPPAWSDTRSRPDPARIGAAIAYDASRRQVVVFGGNCTSCLGLPLVDLGDTWTWDGSWAPRAGATRPQPTGTPAA